MRLFFPTRALVLLLAIGLADLVATVGLNARGMIEERNPIMAPLLAGGGFSFAAVKTTTLVVAWGLLARYARTDLRWVRGACLCGSVAYVVLLGTAFFTPH